MAISQSAGRVIKFGAAADTTTRTLHVAKLVWVGPTTAGHSIEIRNTAGDTLWAATCSVANEYVEADFGDADLLHAVGFTVQTMTSGYLLVYLK